MKFNKNLASIHGYLCADGYVITNPKSQKHKYYYIGLRNTNLTLLKDFQEKFHRKFGIRPVLTEERCKIQNKNLFFILTKNFTYYSDKWSLPKLSKNLLSSWLRSYFDCDGWVSVVKAKDRKIGLDSINKKGLYQIKKVMKRHFKITSTIKKRKNRNIWSLTICGKDDLLKFEKYIGFLHPRKKEKLEEALNSYQSYEWTLPKEKAEIIKFIRENGRLSIKRKEIRMNSIIKRNLNELRNRLNSIGIKSKILGPWENNWGSLYYCLTIKENQFSKLEEVN
ncbi:MAG: hypothetical protein HYW26_04650 [Candidatus Aenigmarchaeota archaeon]|nr:hypothetical protein [Candidatus Aenigmarchaeota archaeon]